MNFSYLLKDKGMSVYECSKKSGIPYSTLSDVIKGRTQMDKLSFRWAYYLAKTIDMPMEELYERTHIPERTSFETFKNQVRHELKNLGDREFIKETIKEDLIMKYWEREWFHESFYLLAMVDYLSVENDMLIERKYDELRKYKLPEVVFPMDINIAAKLGNGLDIREKAINESIPEFMKYNIVEKEIRDVY